MGSPVAVVFDPIRDGWDHSIERARLASRGVALVEPATREEAERAIAGADVVVVTAGPFGAGQIVRLRGCVGILCYSVGTDAVDAQAAAAAGIPVANVPDYCTEEVADHALALLLAADAGYRP